MADRFEQLSQAFFQFKPSADSPPKVNQYSQRGFIDRESISSILTIGNIEESSSSASIFNAAIRFDAK